MLIASWKAHLPELTLVVCDYGLTPEQVALVRSVPGVHYAAGSAPHYSHAWEGKARLGSYLEQFTGHWKWVVWIDADALFLRPLPDLSAIIEGYDLRTPQ